MRKVNADDKRQAAELIEFDGGELRRDPLVVRKATLTSVLAKARVGIRYNEHLEFDDGEASNEKDSSHLTRAIERAYGTSLREGVRASKQKKTSKHIGMLPYSQMISTP